jgi:hypothetical protein
MNNDLLLTTLFYVFHYSYIALPWIAIAIFRHAPCHG